MIPKPQILLFIGSALLAAGGCAHSGSATSVEESSRTRTPSGTVVDERGKGIENARLAPGRTNTGTIAVAVVDAETGGTLQYANVFVLDAPAPGVLGTVGPENYSRGGQTDVAGTLVITDVPVGMHAASVRMIGYLREARDSIQVLEDQTTKVTFRLKLNPGNMY